MTGSQPVLHACTIVSKNYLSYARVLARSFLDHHPGGRFFVLLVDRIDGHFDASAEPFETDRDRDPQEHRIRQGTAIQVHGP